MPAFLKTPHDEELWSKAKARAAEEGHHEDWAYVTGIYKRMKGGTVDGHAKQAVGADLAAMANHTAGALRYNLGALKARAGHFVGHQMEDMKSRLVGAVADRVAGQVAPHVEQLMTPQGLGQIAGRPEVKQLVHEHLSNMSPVDMIFGRAKNAAEDPHAAYMATKAAGETDRILMGLGIGAAAGALNAKLFPLELKAEPRTKAEERRDILLEGGAAGGLGAIVGKAMSQPGFEAAYQAHRVAKPEALGEALKRLPQVLKKRANAPFSIFGGAPEQQYDKETHAKLVRAKAQLSRAKLVNAPGFAKLSPEAQKEILRAHDRVHKTIEDAVLAGKYGGM